MTDVAQPPNSIPLAEDDGREIPECCGTCLCYAAVTEAGGLCRRGPPQVVVMMVPDATQPAVILKPGEAPRQRMVPQAQGQWPPVPVHGWCFDYVDPRGEGFDSTVRPSGQDS